MLSALPDEVVRGSVMAAAGCGKTHLIASCIARHEARKPILVLTHTLAGVAALKVHLRLQRAEAAAYRLMTLDGFAQWLVGTFPKRTGVDVRAMRAQKGPFDYAGVQRSACLLLRNGHLDGGLPATFTRVFVDEYQDCSIDQHALVDAVACRVPTCVFGDPMQGIFAFSRAGAGAVDWDSDVLPSFPSVGSLKEPWRWRKTGHEHFGHWLIAVRGQLEAGAGVNLASAPPEVDWRPHTKGSAHAVRRKAAACTVHGAETILVLAQSFNVNGQHRLARQTHNAKTVEAADLEDLTVFAERFELDSATALDSLLDFAASTVANANIASLKARLQSLRARKAVKEATALEEVALLFQQTSTMQQAAAVLEAVAKQPKARVFRREVFYGVVAGLRRCGERNCSLPTSIDHVREGYRHAGRKVTGRVIGSTLLLKGLEADAAVVLYPEEMDAKNLYVAMTRGARRLIVCSSAETINPLPIR